MKFVDFTFLAADSSPNYLDNLYTYRNNLAFERSLYREQLSISPRIRYMCIRVTINERRKPIDNVCRHRSVVSTIRPMQTTEYGYWHACPRIRMNTTTPPQTLNVYFTTWNSVRTIHARTHTLSLSLFILCGNGKRRERGGKRLAAHFASILRYIR